MSMTLYWGSGSPVSWRAQLGFALKRLDYQSHRLDLGNREHRGEAYLAINPKGTFPVLVDGELVVRDSLAILAYLDRRDPEPPLFGATAQQAAMIWQFVFEHDAGLAERVATITAAVFREKVPSLEPAREAVSVLTQDLDQLDALLQQGDWLFGAHAGAAEAVCYPTLHRLLRAATKPRAETIGLHTNDPLAECPSIGAWMARTNALPGVDETYPPHWRD